MNNLEEKPTIALLDYKLNELTCIVKDGFKTVHDKQDKTNGNVKKNTEWRLINDSKIKNLCSIVYGLIGLALVSVFTAIYNLIIR
jgi:hypothetical protein